MNREIKFKAVLEEDFDYEPEDRPTHEWKYLKKGIYPITGLHFFEGQELTSISIDNDDYGELQDLWLDMWPFELIEFSGLCDINGTNIYEGDILQIPYTYYDRIDCAIKVPYDEYIIGVVAFSQKSGAFGIIIPSDEDELSRGFNSFDFAFKNIGYECEIIGNQVMNRALLLDIFEDNESLLEESDD